MYIFSLNESNYNCILISFIELFVLLDNHLIIALKFVMYITYRLFKIIQRNHSRKRTISQGYVSHVASLKKH